MDAIFGWIYIALVSLCIIVSLWEFMHKREMHRKIHSRLVGNDQK